MRFTSLFVAAAAILPVFSAAVPADDAALEARAFKGLEERSSNGGLAIAKSISVVTAAVAALDKSIVNVTTASDDQIVALLNAISFQTGTLTNQTIIIKKAGNIEASCVDYVQWFVQKLINTIDKLATDLIKIRPVLIPDGYDTLVPGILSDQQTLANAYADVLIAKVPKASVALAKSDKQKVNDAFNKIYAVYGQPSS